VKGGCPHVRGSHPIRSQIKLLDFSDKIIVSSHRI
jgi:hypothetical protein